MRNYIKKPAFTAPLLMLTVSILSVLSAVVMSKLSFKSSDELFLSYIITEILVFVLPGILYVKLKPRGYTADLNLISFGFSALPLILLTFCAMVFGGVLMSLLYMRFPAIGADGGLTEQALALTQGDYITDVKDVIYVSLALAVIPAVCEEFIFRGVLLREYREYGMLPSVLITSVLFAFLHFDLSLFPYYFLAGMALGVVAYATRSTVASMILHLLFNLFSLFVQPLVFNFISLAAGTTLVFYLSTVFFLLFFMLLIGECERLFQNYSTAGLKSYAPPKTGSAILHNLEIFTPTLLLCALVFVLTALHVFKLPS